jgi:hypothetical protein
LLAQIKKSTDGNFKNPLVENIFKKYMEEGNTAQKRLSQALKSLNDFMEQPSPLDDKEAL